MEKTTSFASKLYEAPSAEAYEIHLSATILSGTGTGDDWEDHPDD